MLFCYSFLYFYPISKMPKSIWHGYHLAFICCGISCHLPFALWSWTFLHYCLLILSYHLLHPGLYRLFPPSGILSILYLYFAVGTHLYGLSLQLTSFQELFSTLFLCSHCDRCLSKQNSMFASSLLNTVCGTQKKLNKPLLNHCMLSIY